MKQANMPQNNSTSASIADINPLKAQFFPIWSRPVASESRRTYLDAVEQLTKYTWCSPADLTESQVNHYLLERHRQNPAKGTFKVMRFALRFCHRDQPEFVFQSSMRPHDKPEISSNTCQNRSLHPTCSAQPDESFLFSAEKKKDRSQPPGP